MKKQLKLLFMKLRPLVMWVLSIFFDGRYLVGRHFEGDSLAGYKWALRAVWQRNILRLGKPHPFPVGLTCRLSSAKNIKFHPDDLNNFQSPGVYFQNFYGLISFGRGCYIGPNVGIITANHDPSNPDKHLPAKDVIIGENCWIGMNSVILPGVVLGPRTIVGAGSIVTRSFTQGNCTIVGTPARLVISNTHRIPSEYTT